MINRIKAFFTHNLNLKIISLVLAILLWFYVQSYKNPEVNRSISDVPITITGEDVIGDSGFVVSDSSKNLKVIVTVTAKRSMLKRLDPSDFTAVIDVSNCNSAENHSLPVRVHSTNSSVSVAKIMPEKISVEIDKMHIVEKDIKIDFVNGVGDDYYIDENNVNFNPAKAIVRLPKLKEDSVDSVRVSVDMNGVKNTLTNVFKGVAVDKNGEIITDKHISLSTENISVTVPVYKKKTVDINIKNLPSGRKYELTNEKVTVAGEASVINSLKSVEGYIQGYHENPDEKSYKVKLQVDKFPWSETAETQINFTEE